MFSVLYFSQKIITEFISINYFELIIASIIVLLTYKLIQAWSFNKHFSYMDHTISNPNILNRAMYKQDEMPPPYPNLWYPVIQSEDIKPGQVKSLFTLEQNLVAFRTVSGKVHVLDAFCAHMGVHLGVGGNVVGEDIRCPFHSWTFNGNGDCTGVPGLNAKNVPKARIKSWKCIEINNWVYIWYHNQGEEPDWKPTQFEELSGRINWAQHSTYTNGHLVDILANIADVDHFTRFHSVFNKLFNISPEQIVFRTRYSELASYILHLDVSDFEGDFDGEKSQDKRIAIFNFSLTPVLLGIPLTPLIIDIKVIFQPPCLQFSQTVRLLNLKCWFLTGFYPVATFRNYMTDNVYHDGSFKSKLFARIFFNFISATTEPEQLIYNHKKFLANPCFTSLDKLSVKYFRWFKDNFYT